MSASAADAQGSSPASRPMSASATTMSRLMVPTDANVHGNVHGGAILRYVDETAAAAAHRHARSPKVVTVALERMEFREPVFIGDLLHIHATVRCTGRTSMLVGVRVEAEDLETGRVRHTSSCYVTFVALDKFDKPSPVPEVVPETDRDRERVEKARRVQAAIREAMRAE